MMTSADLIQKLVDVIMQIAHLVKKYPIPIVGSLVTLATLGVILYMNLHTPSAPGVGTPPTGEAHSDFASLGGYKIIGTVLLIVGVFGYWFVSVFTAEATDKNVNFMIRYCYTVTLFLLASFSFFFFFPVSETGEHDFQWPEFSGPVGVVLGCTKPPRSDFVPASGVGDHRNIQLISSQPGGDSIGDRTNEISLKTSEQKYVAVTPRWLPREIECGNDTLQWLLNVGGKVAPYHRGASAGRVEMVSHGTGSGIDGQSQQAQFSEIQGGLVVPLYFIVIALVGGLVSMMRRIPEYQARVSPNSTARLSNEEAREQLVFQLMQVMSAPLIAATAYYLVDPSTRTTSIALAFIAGFSSETVLLYIRALTTKLQPEKQDRVPLILSRSSIDFGKVPVKQSSAPSRIMLHNRGTSAIKVDGINFTGDFSYDQNAAQSVHPRAVIAPGTSAVLEVIFNPQTPGLQKGTLTIVDDAIGSPRTIPLSGEGTE
jgi:hypothetical protein